MAPTPVLSGSDSPQTTVADLVGNPLTIPARILSLLNNGFISEVLLRNAGANGNGLVAYSESSPLYLDGDLESVAEFAEIPVAAGQIGLPRIAVAIKKGRGIRVSKEMRDENLVDLVNRQITQLVNTAIRAEERALRALLLNPAIPTIAATAAWDTGSARPRRDIANAMEVVGSATPNATAADDNFGFVADTLAMDASLSPVLLDNDQFLAVYKDSLAPESIAYTGRLPKDILGLAGLTSRSFPKDRVLVTERGTVGFYSDTRTRQVTPLYPEGGGPNGGPTESFRADLTSKRALGLDQPKAACWITGVRSA